MKLVFLPGLDGTGRLFSPVLPFLSKHDCEVVALPTTGAQDYATLAQYVASQLPKQDFVLIAESFSGPIGAELAYQQIDGMCGVIFVATFLNTPRKLPAKLASLLPIRLLMGLPFENYFYRMFLFGPNAPESFIDLFRSVIRAVPPNLIKARLHCLSNMEEAKKTSSIPALYISATSDKLVPNAKAKEFEKAFYSLRLASVKGSHFVLQTKPRECARVIDEFIGTLTRPHAACQATFTSEINSCES